MLKNTDPALAYQNSPLRGWQSEYPTQSGWDTNTFVAAKALPTKGENERTISKERKGREREMCVVRISSHPHPPHVAQCWKEKSESEDGFFSCTISLLRGKSSVFACLLTRQMRSLRKRQEREY